MHTVKDLNFEDLKNVSSTHINTHFKGNMKAAGCQRLIKKS